MTKLLFIVAVTILLVLWFKHMGRSRGDKERKGPPDTASKGEDMVRCVTCGVNLPRSEAVLSRGRFYCCDAHRQQDQG